ncbi:MAG: glycosyltransferase 87 family protein [Acidimicrobiia bacterium]
MGIYLASRLVVLVSVWMTSRLNDPISIGSALTGWDGGWYLAVAEHGYPHDLPPNSDTTDADQTTAAFFPLYPLGIRAVGALGFSPRMAGLIVAGVAGLVAVVLLWLLLERCWGSDAADRGVALFCFFPGALVLSMVYAEPLMLALAAGCLLALLSRWWVTAGVLAGLATATRPNALALVPACAWAAGTAIRHRREWRALVAPLLAPVGFVAFQVFLWVRTGYVDAWFRNQRDGWEEQVNLGATWDKIDTFFRRPFGDVNITVAVAGTLFLVVALVFLIRARPPAPVLAYTLGVMALALVSQTLGARPRFVLTAFPLVAVAGHWLKGTAFSVVLACSATVLGGFAILSLASLLATP